VKKNIQADITRTLLSDVPRTPAYEFLLMQLYEGAYGGASFEAAILNLLVSDVPLDRDVRKLIANFMLQLVLPKSEIRRRANRANDFNFAKVRAALRDEGWKASEVDDALAVVTGVAPEARRQRQTRTHRKNRRAR
jgi:hypothetical protein